MTHRGLMIHHSRCNVAKYTSPAPLRLKKREQLAAGLRSTRDRYIEVGCDDIPDFLRLIGPTRHERNCRLREKALLIVIGNAGL